MNITINHERLVALEACSEGLEYFERRALGKVLNVYWTKYEQMDFIRSEGRKWFGWLVNAGILPMWGMEGADFSGAYIAKADLRGAILTRSSFSGAYLLRTDFSMARLVGSNLSKATLTEARFRRSNVSHANLCGAVLQGAFFTGADLSGARLIGADLSEADFTGADLSGAGLIGANLSGADFTDANLTEATRSPEDPSIHGWIVKMGRLKKA